MNEKKESPLCGGETPNATKKRAPRRDNATCGAKIGTDSRNSKNAALCHADGEARLPTKKSRRGLATAFCRRFDIPADLAAAGMTLELRGDGELLVCGCREITAYSERYVKVRLRTHTVAIRGESLCLTAYYDGQTGIDGVIRVIEIDPPGVDKGQK